MDSVRRSTRNVLCPSVASPPDREELRSTVGGQATWPLAGHAPQPSAETIDIQIRVVEAIDLQRHGLRAASNEAAAAPPTAQATKAAASR